MISSEEKKKAFLSHVEMDTKALEKPEEERRA
jgi:hypothetical protein